MRLTTRSPLQEWDGARSDKVAFIKSFKFYAMNSQRKFFLAKQPKLDITTADFPLNSDVTT